MVKEFKKILKDTFKSISDRDSVFGNLSGLPFLVIPMLFFIRLLHTQLHVLFVHPEFYFSEFAGFIDLLASFQPMRGFKYIYYFLIVSTAIYLISKKYGDGMDYKKIEEGVFYIMTAPLILTFLDIPHIFIGSKYLWKTCFHISLPIILVVMPLQISSLLGRAWNLSKKIIVLPALLIPLRFKWFPVYMESSGSTPPWLPMQLFILVSGIFLIGFYLKRRDLKRTGMITLMLAYGIFLFLG